VRIHPRARLVSEADLALAEFLLELERKHDLTYEELFTCLADRLSALARGMFHEEEVTTALADGYTFSDDHRRDHLLLDFSVEVERLRSKYDLTYGEMFSTLGARVTDLARYLIRTERHPDEPDKKGDEA